MYTHVKQRKDMRPLYADSLDSLVSHNNKETSIQLVKADSCVIPFSSVCKTDEIAQAVLEDKIIANTKTTYTNAKELWDNLNKVYEDTFLINKIYLRRQLCNLNMNDKVSIHDHLNKFNSLLTELTGVGVKIDEE